MVMTYFKLLSQHLPQHLIQTTKISVQNADFRVDNRIRDFPNTKQECQGHSWDS